MVYLTIVKKFRLYYNCSLHINIWMVTWMVKLFLNLVLSTLCIPIKWSSTPNSIKT